MELGVVEIDITPPKEIWKHISLGGYSRLKKCQGIIEPIFARLLLIYNYNNKQKQKGEREKKSPILIISIDQVGIPHIIAQEIRRTIEERYSIPFSNILLYATHNHYTPDILGLMPAPSFPMLFSPGAISFHYINYLKAKIFQSIPKLFITEQVFPVVTTLEYPEGDLIDRRIIYRKILKRVHPPLSFIGFKTLEGEYRALIMISSLHDTMYPPNEYKIMSGQTGAFCNAVKNITNQQKKPAIGLFLLGASGNISPIRISHLLPKQYHKKFSKDIPREVIHKYIKDWGQYFAKKALETLETIEKKDTDNHSIDLASAEIIFPIKFSFPTTFKYRIINLLLKSFKQHFLIPLFRITRKRKFSPINIRKINNKILAQTSVSILKINNTLFANTPGEPFYQMGKDIEESIKQIIPKNYIVHCTTLVNDSFGYMFTDKETIIKQNGYEPKLTITPLSGAYVRNSLIKLAEKLNFN